MLGLVIRPELIPFSLPTLSRDGEFVVAVAAKTLKERPWLKGGAAAVATHCSSCDNPHRALDTGSPSHPILGNLHSTFILAFHEDTAVKTIALGDLDFIHAKQAYDAVPLTFAKVLIQKPSNMVLCRDGWNEYVDMCIQQVRLINAVFPQGSWRETSEDLESCFDPETGKYVLRCSCANRDGGRVVNAVEFKPEDCFTTSPNGELVKAN